MAQSKDPKVVTQQNQLSSLNFLEVAEIRNGVIVLKEKQMRMILSVSSANFALKSTKEQDIIINTFQGVLNSLEEPVQILVQSRKIDLTNYIDRLKKLEEEQKNDLLKVKMQEYITYIQQMIQQINIMSKQFYVIVGYDPILLKNDIFSKFMKSLNPARYYREDEEKFNTNRQTLVSRADQVAAKFRQLDLTVNVLKTDQLIALVYNSYNPDTLESIKLENIDTYDLSDYDAKDQFN
jgi:hypothetical protein